RADRAREEERRELPEGVERERVADVERERVRAVALEDRQDARAHLGERDLPRHGAQRAARAHVRLEQAGGMERHLGEARALRAHEALADRVRAVGPDLEPVAVLLHLEAARRLADPTVGLDALAHAASRPEYGPVGPRFPGPVRAGSSRTVNRRPTEGPLPARAAAGTRLATATVRARDGALSRGVLSRRREGSLGSARRARGRRTRRLACVMVTSSSRVPSRAARPAPTSRTSKRRACGRTRRARSVSTRASTRSS